MPDSKKGSTKQHFENKVQREQKCASTISADSLPSKERLTTSGQESLAQPRMTRPKVATKRRALSYLWEPAVSRSSDAYNSTENKASSDTDSGKWKKLLVCTVAPQPLVSAVLSPADTWTKSNDSKNETLIKQERLSQLFDCNYPPDRSVPLSQPLIGVTSGHPNSSANKPSKEVIHENVDITLRYYQVMRDSPKLPLMDTKLRTCDGFYKCRICRRVFFNRFSLTGHYRSHYDTSYVVKPYYCSECEQEHTFTAGLRSNSIQNCNALRTRNQKYGALSSGNPHSTRCSRSGPMKISVTQSKRKWIKTKQTERVRRTQVITLCSKFAGNSKIEEPTREEADASNSTEHARSPVKQMNKDADDGFSEGSQIQQSVEMSDKTSDRINHRAFSFPGGGGFGAHSHSWNYPANEGASTAAQANSGECIEIPQSWDRNYKESQTSGLPELIYEKTALTEATDSSYATGKIQLKQILEQTFRPEKLLQRMSVKTSGALSQRKGRNAQPFWTILHSAHSAFRPVNRNHAHSNPPNHCIPSVSEPVRAHLVNRGVHGTIKPTSGPLCSNGCTCYPLVYPYLCRLTDARALDEQISLTRSSQFESSQLRQLSGAGERCLSEDCRSFSPDSACSLSLCCNFSTNQRSTSSSARTSVSGMSGVSVAN